MPAGAGDGGGGREDVDGELGDNGVWTISPRVKDDTPRREGVPSRGALSISVCRRRSEHARQAGRRSAARECRSAFGVLMCLRLMKPPLAATAVFNPVREFARA